MARKGTMQTPRRVTLNASTATLVSDANKLWVSRVFTNIDASITVYWGPSTVTIANGVPLLANAVMSEDVISNAVYMIAASGTPDVSVIEIGG